MYVLVVARCNGRRDDQRRCDRYRTQWQFVAHVHLVEGEGGRAPRGPCRSELMQRDVVMTLHETQLDRHADLELICGARDDVGDEPDALFEFDQPDVEGVVERRHLGMMR